MGGWLENEFLKKTPSPKFELESQLGTSDLEFAKSLIGPSLDSLLQETYCLILYSTVLVLKNKTFL